MNLQIVLRINITKGFMASIQPFRVKHSLCFTLMSERILRVNTVSLIGKCYRGLLFSSTNEIHRMYGFVVI